MARVRLCVYESVSEEKERLDVSRGRIQYVNVPMFEEHEH